MQRGPYGWLESKVAWEIAIYCESRNADESQALTLACAQHCINECFIMTRMLQEIWTFCINRPRGMGELVVIKHPFKDNRTGLISLYEITHQGTIPIWESTHDASLLSRKGKISLMPFRNHWRCLESWSQISSTWIMQRASAKASYRTLAKKIKS